MNVIPRGTSARLDRRYLAMSHLHQDVLRFAVGSSIQPATEASQLSVYADHLPMGLRNSEQELDPHP